MKTTHIFRLMSIVMIALLFSCNQKKAKTNSKYAANYVYAYSSGPVGRNTPVRVRFTSGVVGQDQIGKPVANGFFSISPSLKGKAYWEDAQTIKFQPEEPLNDSKNYVGEVRLDRVFQGVPKEAQSFQFDFNAKPQSFEVVVEGLQTKEVSDLKNCQLQGFVRTTDAANDVDVEKVITAKQNNQTLSVGWVHSPDKLRHTFYVNDVKRGDAASSVALAWNGKSLEVSNDGKLDYEVPALNDFKVIGTKIFDGEDKQVIINFSDPIDHSQDLSGLIHFDAIDVSACVVDKNIVRLYSNSKQSGSMNVVCENGILNTKGKKFENPFQSNVFFGDDVPKVKLCGYGSILPSSENGLMFPFEAKNLNAVNVEVFKIFNNNVLQFLQTADLDNQYDYGLERVGRILVQKKVELSTINTANNKGKFVRYNLDLSKLIKDDPAAVYQVRIGFSPQYSTYQCQELKDKNNLAMLTQEPQYDDNGDLISLFAYNYDYEYEGEDGDSEGENPCNPNYYTYRNAIRRNILASNIGVIAKIGNDKSAFVAVTDLRSTNPIPNASVEFIDYQNQKMITAKTNAEGICKVDLQRSPYVCLVAANKENGYLKLQDGSSNNLSRFAVEGDVIQKGLKGFIYGERGVWRPGDSIYLNFVLENKNKALPPNHPITFELQDSRGQIQQRFTTVHNLNNVYNLTTFTRSDAPTGNYIATVKVGGTSFSKTLKIETVKPNRLKVKLDFGKEKLSQEDNTVGGVLTSSWLTGPPAAGLNSKIDVQLSSIKTEFPNHKLFVFDDPARNFTSEPQVIFDGNLDDNGKANIPLKLDLKTKAPGKLKASFGVKVMERGGDFSVDNFNMEYNPYNAYVGVKIPISKYGEKYFTLNQNNNISMVVLDKNGKPLANTQIAVGLYKVNWRWWWDASNDDVANFNSDAHVGSVENATLTTNAKGEIDWKINIKEWGRYFVRAVHTASGHASGDFFTAGQPYFDENDENNESNLLQARKAAALLPVNADKEKYSVGEKVVLEIPAAKAGRCLVTIENGSRVIQHFWKEMKDGSNSIDFKTTPEMSPNVYAHVTMIQPHGQVQNDLPMRQYGIVPITVEDKNTLLEPWVSLPSVLEPEQNFFVEVGEKSSKAMTYTIAIVDEGLLDLTRFKTPDPHGSFYAKEALGVRSWDIYDQVLSAAYRVEQDRVLNIGGDGLNLKAGENNRANRFKPVVQHLGPFYLAPRKKAQHKIKLPNYIGAVRVMIVAADNGAYGNTEQSVPVRKPLMLLATLPRVLSPGETLKLPVDIFAMDKKVTNVSVTVQESSGLIAIEGGSQRSLNFTATGEKQTDFDIKVNDGEGVAKFKVLAEGGGEKVWQDIEIQVRNPNPVATNVVEKTLNAGESIDLDALPIGTYGTNEGVMEISSIPPINLGARLSYLLSYPHGCVEQTTSTAFPQLYVSRFLELTESQKNIAATHVKNGIDNLQKFQVENGGFGYWQGATEASPWGTTYVGHFLIEAQKNGYTIPAGVLEKWKNYQQNVARRFDPLNNYDQSWGGGSQLDQAYRLYTLAAAGAPEMGAMNRLREHQNLQNEAKWRLAAAYALAGKTDEAKKLVANANKVVQPYIDMGYTYGSDLRDEAQILETLLLLNDKNGAAEVARTISNKMSSQNFYATQSLAQSMLAMAKFLGDNSVQNGFTFSYKTDKSNIANVTCKAALSQTGVQIDKGVRKVTVKNTSKGVLFVRLIMTGKPAIGDQTAYASNLNMNVVYKNLKGEVISPASVVQGTDFLAEVTVQNPGSLSKNYNEMALSQVFPSGWEIHNARMTGVTYGGASSYSEYQDIRDDRVYTYFDLPMNKAVTYRIQLHAAYIGKYYLPNTSCEAMYNSSIAARQPGQWVTVVKKQSEG